MTKFGSRTLHLHTLVMCLVAWIANDCVIFGIVMHPAMLRKPFVRASFEFLLCVTEGPLWENETLRWNILFHKNICLRWGWGCYSRAGRRLAMLNNCFHSIICDWVCCYCKKIFRFTAMLKGHVNGKTRQDFPLWNYHAMFLSSTIEP